MKPALLDINVLLALVDPAHIHHNAAHAWWASIEQWASCPITQNGFVRILSSPQYPGLSLRPIEAAALLTELTTTKPHAFWKDEASLLDAERFQLEAATSGQLTDVYLLGLAVQMKGTFATFDTRIVTEAVRGGRAALQAIPPLS